MDEHEDKGESPVKTTPVKTERMKSNDSMEMLKFFDLLPEGAREGILKNLCRNATEFTKDEGEEEELLVDTKLTVKDYKSAMEGKSDREKASLYDEYIEAQRKKAHTKKYEGKIPSHQLESELQITLTSRSNRDLGEVKVVLCKQDRGDDPISRKMNSFLFLCGWSSYAETMPHVHSLLQCLHQPPVSHDLEFMAKQAQWVNQPLDKQWAQIF